MATWTQSDIDALKLSIGRGTLSVSFADRSVTYHSLKEMMALLAVMEAALATSEGRAGYRLAVTNKGV